MNFFLFKKTCPAFFLAVMVFSLNFSPARAASGPSLRIEVAIRHHHFETNVSMVPKGQPLLFRVTNFGKSMEEFESYDMAFEVVVRPGQTVEIPVSGLGPGTYEYFGDFHPRTARGTITVK